MYNTKFLTSTSFETPIISVGNLAVGGSGKTPMVEYLIKTLQSDYNIATLSRGYGRKTRGFRWVQTEDNYQKSGDEPLQIKIKFPHLHVAVCENRVAGVNRILREKPDINLILLDDAFQHRAIAPSIQLLLSDYNNPFYTDWIMPVGKLRESRKGYQRAHAIIYTKCPKDFAPKKSFDKTVFYSTIQYQSIDANKEIYGFSGLANNTMFKTYLNNNYTLAGFKSFPDHYNFKSSDLDFIAREAQGAILVCTEKDWIKIKDLPNAHEIQFIRIENAIEGTVDFSSWIKDQIKNES
jgi:tetraacyldisaccharide 4'-kinase